MINSKLKYCAFSRGGRGEGGGFPKSSLSPQGLERCKICSLIIYRAIKEGRGVDVNWDKVHPPSLPPFRSAPHNVASAFNTLVQCCNKFVDLAFCFNINPNFLHSGLSVLDVLLYNPVLGWTNHAKDHYSSALYHYYNSFWKEKLTTLFKIFFFGSKLTFLTKLNMFFLYYMVLKS